ncbi:MAG: hypothetical protein IJ055_05390 [Oscillospiraceae bacterium]|nr:hypothetical protein [Oscillospiraceae bacterium]
METIEQRIIGFFEKQGWDYAREENLVQSGVALESAPGGASIHAVIGPSAYTLLVAPDVQIPAEYAAQALAFANGVNVRMLLGGFFFDEEERLLVFRLGQIGSAPDAQSVEDAFLYAISVVEDTGDAVSAIAQGEADAQAALAMCFSED